MMSPPEPPVSQVAAAVSPGPVQLSTAPPPPQSPAMAAFGQLGQVHSHSLPQVSAIATPYQHTTTIQLGNQVVQQQQQPPAPAVLSVLAYDAASGTVFDPRSGLATKIKGGLALTSLAKTSNKFSPY